MKVSSASLLLPSLSLAAAFCEPTKTLTNQVCTHQSDTQTCLGAYARPEDYNYLLEDFRTAGGDIVNPYRVLKLERNADRAAIKKQYRTMSKLYHPDVVRFVEAKDLPGKCMNLEDVRDEWEKILLSYEILSDHKLRIRYDRNSALNDIPAVVEDAIGRGWDTFTTGVSMAFKTMTESIEEGKRISRTIDHAISEMAVQAKKIEVAAQDGLRKYDEPHQRKQTCSTATDMDSISSNRAGPLSAQSCATSRTVIPEKIVSLPPPSNGKQYSPYEACSIIHQHDEDPLMDKPKAMKIMLDRQYVPVKRAQLYLVFNKFKNGQIPEDKVWGRVGRPARAKQ